MIFAIFYKGLSFWPMLKSRSKTAIVMAMITTVTSSARMNTLRGCRLAQLIQVYTVGLYNTNEQLKV